MARTNPKMRQNNCLILPSFHVEMNTMEKFLVMGKMHVANQNHVTLHEIWALWRQLMRAKSQKSFTRFLRKTIFLGKRWKLSKNLVFFYFWRALTGAKVLKSHVKLYDFCFWGVSEYFCNSQWVHICHIRKNLQTILIYLKWKQNEPTFCLIFGFVRAVVYIKSLQYFDKMECSPPWATLSHCLRQS